MRALLLEQTKLTACLPRERQISLLISKSEEAITYYIQKGRAWQEQTARPWQGSFVENVVREAQDYNVEFSRGLFLGKISNHSEWTGLRGGREEILRPLRMLRFAHFTILYHFPTKQKPKPQVSTYVTSSETIIYFSQLMSVLLTLTFAVLVAWLLFYFLASI